MSTSLIIADDHKVVREGVRAVLDREPDMDVVGEAADGLEALDLVEELSPDILVLDLSMPGLPGLEVIRRMVESSESKVVVLTMHSDQRYAARALSYGASAYVTKSADIESLNKAIRVAVDGGSYVSPPLPEYLTQDVSKSQKGDTDLYDFITNREREVLHLVADGLTNREIASRLSISKRTVEAHRSRLMIKLRINSQAELIRYALRRQTQLGGE